jgi:hypothetical protein
MAQGRGCELPEGMKDILELIQQREDDDAASLQQLRQLVMIMQRDCEVHPARIIAVLRQRIDQDLLFAEDFELVRPLVRPIIAEIWRGAHHLTSLHIYGRTHEKIVDASTEIIRTFLGMMRERYLDYRNGRRLDF